MSDSFAGGKLKLKGVKDGKVNKKKKKKRVTEEAAKATLEEEKHTVVVDTPASGTRKTKAEIAFKKAQEKREGDKILKKAQVSHKERVEQFNEHLDSLIEHFDIPKVSWTK
eukprot:sb/3477111/